MGLFDFLKKKEEEPVNTISVADDVIVAPADGEQIDIATVSDPVFAEKMMGDGVAFKFPLEKVAVCVPANGTLSVLFPTGHAFDVTMNNGVEVLVHIGTEELERDVTIKHKGRYKQVRKTKMIKMIRISDEVPARQNPQDHHKITCPCWGVAGHMRTYKTGKQVWIKPYRKGKQRHDPAAYVPKEYQLPEEE